MRSVLISFLVKKIIVRKFGVYSSHLVGMNGPHGIGGIAFLVSRMKLIDEALA